MARYVKIPGSGSPPRYTVHLKDGTKIGECQRLPNRQWHVTAATGESADGYCDREWAFRALYDTYLKDTYGSSTMYHLQST